MGFRDSLSAIVHNKKQPESYEKKKEYSINKILGNGTFGNVRMANRISDGQPVAIKSIPKVCTATTKCFMNNNNSNMVHYRRTFRATLRLCIEK
jgi:serine/threonine protein kinase